MEDEELKKFEGKDIEIYFKVGNKKPKIIQGILDSVHSEDGDIILLKPVVIEIDDIIKIKEIKEIEDIRLKQLTKKEINESFKKTALKISQAVEEKKLNKEIPRDEYTEEIKRAEQLALEESIDKERMEEYEEEKKRESADRYCGGHD